MYYEEFSIAELEEKVRNVEPVEEKIKLIAYEIRRCKRTIQDIEEEVTNIDPSNVKLITKVNCNDVTVLSILNDNKEIKYAATKELLSFCSKKCCERLRSYLEKAQTDYEYYQAELDVKVKSNCIPITGNKNNVPSSCEDKIVWMYGKEKLLIMFTKFKENNFITECTKDETLSHFADENQIPFFKGTNIQRMFRWRASDSSFAVFVNELAKRSAIDENEKFKVFVKHFLNKNGNPFRNLAQKKYYTENYSKTGNMIREILDSINLTVIAICLNLLSSFMLE